MTLKIRRATVLGAGVMGAQIAAHLAAAGVRVHLLDLAAKEPPADPKLKKAVGFNIANTRAIVAIEQMKKMKPAPLYSPSVLPNIIPGNFDDDMAVLADADWVIEAVIERLDIKQSLHKRIAEHVRPGVPVTTNTSGISLSSIVEGLPEHYQKVFFGTHFFNPPRYMKLMEIIPHDIADVQLVNALTRWISERLGKGIVVAKDTVNFIANRVGVFVNQSTLKHMDELKLNIETVDALTGKLMGRPGSATFRTMDVVGLDTFAHVARNTYDRAPNDPYREWFQFPDWLEGLIEKGHLGQKSGDMGCYKKSRDAKGKRLILVLNPETGEYVEQQVAQPPWLAEASKEPDLIKRLAFTIKQDDNAGKMVWRILRDAFSYSATLLKDITDGSPMAVDDAIRWGFNWEMGPFALWQGLGFDDVLKRMQEENVPLPSWVKPGLKFYDLEPGSIDWHANGGKPNRQYNAEDGDLRELPQPAHAYKLPPFEIKRDERLVTSNRSASLIDIGHGVACLVFHSKMNAIDDDIIALTQQSVAKVSEGFDALVVGNEGPAFSAGANLKMILKMAKEKNWAGIETMIRQFQGTMQMLKFAPFPTVSCPHGMTLGGGVEVCLHTSTQVTNGETYAGLVEVGVGLLPAGGGTKELALRAYDRMSLTERGDPMPFLQRAFMLIGMGRVSTSGLEAKEMGLFNEQMHLTMSQEHQIDRAKHLALQMVHEGYVPKIPQQAVKVVGDPGIQTFKLMLYNMVEGRQVSPYDAHLGEQIATVLCGGAVNGGSIVSEQYLLDLERKAFVELCQREETQARIEHMLKTGKPLRN